jgi:D-beta-D-heptose 7-phosphate kinase/D-beta-D-heptose 1-phosphate adenosyltransferase
MLDNYVYGEVARISPEAPAPVISVAREEFVIGGAGNVARNIASLGATCVYIGIVGEDAGAQLLRKEFSAEPRIEALLLTDALRPTTRKVRFVSEHFSTHLLRADWEVAQPIGPEIERALLDRFESAVSSVGAVVLSDYAKGMLTSAVTRAVIEASRRAGKAVIVDPKGTDFSIYRGATVITPNRKELAEATRRPTGTDDEIAAAAAALFDMLDCEAVLATLSEAGMTLVVRGAAPVHIPAYSVKVLDVSGAGDTVVATLGAFLAVGADYEEAVRAANAAASVVVGKRGTATATAAELRDRILPAAALAPEHKIIFDWSALDRRLTAWRDDGLRIGFTNGCFDLLHPGHVKLLTEARAACDRLVVGLNSNASTRRLKGAGRPVQDQKARAEVLAALEAVDAVVLFEEDTPLELIKRVRPKVLVKGADYRLNEVIGRDFVESQGGEVMLVGLAEGHSTTGIIGQMSS